MAAKNALGIDGTTGIANKSFETGVQDWDFSCGVCHVGGGQMEYDRDMNAYDPNGTSGDNKYFSFDRNRIVQGFLSSTNKMEVDCLMCHLNSSPTGANESGAGRAWYQSYNCGASNPMGPVYDPTCATAGPVPGWGLPGAGPFTPGTAYDPENRNIALKTQQFDLAASLGIGAKVTGWGDAIAGGVDPTYNYIAGIDGVPSTISGVNIQGTPTSQNCSACHARDDNAPAYPGMMTQVRMGYGNMVSLMGIGKALDVDQCTATEVATGNCPNPAKKNTVPWIEFGCKTGMGKRGQKIGNGKNSYWGMSMFNTMFGLGKNPGDLVVSETLTVTNPNLAGIGITSVTTKEKIPDQDVHDKAGFQCATCHYAIGSSKLGGVTTAYGGTFTAATTTVDPVTGATYTMVTIPAEANAHGLNTANGETGEFGVNYPAETIYGIDHQFAQGDNLKDTYGKNNLDGTVSCEGCHITRTHPRVVKGEIDPPIPTHAGFPAIHMDKIACTTCHIPEVYITPFNLKSRDWTIGFIKRGNETNGAFKNIYDWDYDLVTGSGAPMPLLHMWATKYEKKQIYPISPAEMPIWVALDNLGNGLADKGNSGSLDGVTPDNTSAIKTCSFGSRIFAECSSDAECPGGYCVSGITTYASPAKTRDVMAAAETLQANQDPSNPILRRASGNLNTGSIVPIFDGWPFPDGQGIDTKARIDAMIATTNTSTPGTVNLGTEKFSLLKIFHAPFDITHGIVPKEWALGGSKRGGCVSCHSSAQPRSFDANGTDIGPNPNYSEYSTGFFEGVQHWMPQEMGVGKFDMLKNPLTFFADFDCTQIVNGLCMGDAPCTNMCTGMMHYDAGTCAQFCNATVRSMSSCGTGSGPSGSFTDDNLFNSMSGDPAVTFDANHNYAGGNYYLGACINFMQPQFDMAMSWPDGTARAMGMMDGVNGLQAFTIRETLSGNSDGCSPMIGPKNVAIMNFGGWNYQSDPNAIANATQQVNMMGNLNSCMPSGFGGTCTPDGRPGYGGTCAGGFRDGKGCIPMNLGFGTDADCVGTLPDAEASHNPYGLMLSRGEARARFKTQLQQSSVIVPAGALHLSPDNINRVWWPILTEQNPDNPSHKWAWDEAGSANNCGAFQNEPCCTNMYGQPASCADGMNVKTTIHANQLLGFSAAQFVGLTNPGISGHGLPVPQFTWSADTTANYKVNFDATRTTCSNTPCTYSWTFTNPAGTGSGTTTSYIFSGSTGTATLTVTDALGFTSSTSSPVKPIPTIAPVVHGSVSLSRWTVTFTDASTDANGTSDPVTVNWGDGAVSRGFAGDSFSHAYSSSRARSYVISHMVAAPLNRNLVSLEKITVNVPQRYTVSGIVTTSTGSALNGTIMSLRKSGHTVKYAKLTGTNVFSFTGVLPGDYTVRAYKYGATIPDQTVSVLSTNATVTLRATIP